MALFKPTWQIIGNNGYELILIGSYSEALNKAKEVFNESFNIKLLCKGL